MVDFNKGTWKHCDDTYEAIGYNEKTRTLIIQKSNRFGIYFTDIKVTKITRKISKDNTIKLANHTLDVSKMEGLN